MITDFEPPTSTAIDLHPGLRISADSPELAIVQMNALAELTGLPFQCIDAHTGVLLSITDECSEQNLPWSIRCEFIGLVYGSGCRVISFSSGLTVYGVPLPDIDDMPVFAVGCVVDGANQFSFDRSQTSASLGDFPEFDRIAEANDWNADQLQTWAGQLRCCDPKLVRNMLNGAVSRHEKQATERAEIDHLTEQVERAYGETSFIHSLTTRLQVSRSSIDVAELCLERLADFVPSSASALILKTLHGPGEMLTRGQLPFEPADLLDLIRQLGQHDWSRPIVRNQIPGTLLGERFKKLENFVLVQISDGTHEAGWIFACNSARDYGPAESNLLHSVATLMATHHRNRELYRELEDMLLQFTSSLVSTLDAKDPYTRGHSERVAGIAKRIGQELGLAESDIEDIHQAGLLHDIGKIGVHDAVLQKAGKLTDSEFEHVKEHPVIGYRILKGLKRLDKVLPGVRHHHEDFSGTGYPDRLAGSEIPMMARILAVADSYDAMRSDRPYRKGLAVERIEEIFRQGANQQWDPEILDAYFRAREDISAIGAGGVDDA
jgi:HD-GYP domain-containing protein (c-di-GMP phosphodiesterase class II)